MCTRFPVNRLKLKRGLVVSAEGEPPKRRRDGAAPDETAPPVLAVRATSEPDIQEVTTSLEDQLGVVCEFRVCGMPARSTYQR